MSECSAVDASSSPPGWKEVRFGDLISLRGGLSYKASAISASGNPLVTMGCVSSSERFRLAGLKRYDGEYSAAHVLSPGDIVIATRDVTQKRELLGSPAIIPEFLGSGEIIAATNLYKVTNRSSSSNEFLYWMMRGPAYREHIIASAKGTTVLMLTKDAIEEFRFSLPPNRLQRMIAHILGTLDDKIELNRRMNHTLEALARAIFKSWFVDFDPVHAKAEGRGPIGMDPETAALFPDSFQVSSLGKIPEGWEVLKLAEVASVNARTAGKDHPYKEIAYVDISSVTEGAAAEPTRYEFSKAPSRARRLVRDGDTIWATVRPNRKSYLYVHQPPDDLVVSTGFAVLSPTAVPPDYLYHWTTTQSFVDYLTSLAHGAAYPAVRAKTFEDANILVPSSVVLAAFREVVHPLQDLASRGESESRNLAEARDALLPVLLSGKDRISTDTGGDKDE